MPSPSAQHEDARHESADPAAPARGRSRWDIRGCATAIAIVALTTALGWPLHHGKPFHIENENILMLYLLGVVWIATRYSRAAAVLASVLSVAAFDLFFVEPLYRFVVNDQQYLVTFGVMLATALVISALTHRVRAQAEASRQREVRTAALFALARELAVARTAEQIVQTTVRHVHDVLGGRAAVLLPDSGKRLWVHADTDGNGEAVEVRDANAPPDAPPDARPGAPLDADEIGVAQWAFEHRQPAGRDTATLPAAAGQYVPLIDSRGTAGVLAIYPPHGAQGWTAEQRQLVRALADQAAVAVERAMLAEEARQAWERVEAEFLRNTLLSGVSHEMRTPLAAITGAASALVETGERLAPQARADMLDTIYSEAERMERLITNLLDMTRLEAGGLAVKKEWQPLQEVIGSSLRRLERRLSGRNVTTHVPPDLPLVRIDAVLIEQVLMNLLDNAVEYTPAGGGIDIAARAADAAVEVEVADHGAGIPAGTEDRVFQKFFRAGGTENRRGIGLGLAICRGIVEAHGGTIAARNRPEGGAAFRFTIPLGGTPPDVDGTG